MLGVADVAIAIAIGQTTKMTSANRNIAISYLDNEIEGRDIAGFLKTVKRALKQEAITTHELHVVALEIDPSAQTVTLIQDWNACEPETFLASEFFDLIESSRKRSKG
ncbi:hypothetical protein [Yoonia maritima]|uniref:hypothetical protein n=1 Tax=Yoonia maritima TaxID=1435347 RepID=UPI00373602D3